jgi:putative transposase
MARLPRFAVAGQPHLVIQPARAGASLFRCDEDRADYLGAMNEAIPERGIALHAFSLVDDAVYLLLTPVLETDLSRFVQSVKRRYAAATRRRHGPSRVNWGGRFLAAPIDPETHLVAAVLAVEQAPLRSRLASAAIDWIWSSARHHAGLDACRFIVEHPAWWGIGNTPFERQARHRERLETELSEPQLAALLAAARRGWPLGSTAFLTSIGSLADRAIKPAPRGRPRAAVVKK